VDSRAACVQVANDAYALLRIIALALRTRGPVAYSYQIAHFVNSLGKDCPIALVTEIMGADAFLDPMCAFLESACTSSDADTFAIVVQVCSTVCRAMVRFRLESVASGTIFPESTCLAALRIAMNMPCGALPDGWRAVIFALGDMLCTTGPEMSRVLLAHGLDRLLYELIAFATPETATPIIGLACTFVMDSPTHAACVVRKYPLMAPMCRLALAAPATGTIATEAMYVLMCISEFADPGMGDVLCSSGALDVAAHVLTGWQFVPTERNAMVLVWALDTLKALLNVEGLRRGIKAALVRLGAMDSIAICASAHTPLPAHATETRLRAASLIQQLGDIVYDDACGRMRALALCAAP
jgi:hypothetical protein